MTEKTYTTTQILKVAGVPWYKLTYLVGVGKVIPLSRGRGHENRFSQEEALRAVNIIRPGRIVNAKDFDRCLEEIVND